MKYHRHPFFVMFLEAFTLSLSLTFSVSFFFTLLRFFCPFDRTYTYFFFSYERYVVISCFLFLLLINKKQQKRKREKEGKKERVCVLDRAYERDIVHSANRQ